MPLDRSASATGASPGWSPETFTEMERAPNQLPIIYGTARRLYRDLLAAGALTLVPGMALPSAVLAAMGHRVVVVNGSPHLLGGTRPACCTRAT
ncbi:hypothetical protein [Microtetraspora niveoalba]|uniref:hypothetical protein n=1 Tax=Microtetraspora niveoalba TaxID=46175 RepID=UPI0008369A8F|nr:hypothetical protein [Microtetraspora niveoalba]